MSYLRLPLLLSAVFFSQVACLFAQANDDVVSQLKLIKDDYLAGFKSLAGDVQKQYSAGQRQRVKCRQLVAASSDIIATSKDLEILLALSEAAEIGGLPKKTTEIARRVVQLDVTNTKAHGYILREAINNGRIDDARKQLAIAVTKCNDPKSLTPYWGIIALSKAASHDSKAAIECFRRYLPDRYPTMATSTQLFNFLPKVMEEISWCCLDLNDYTALDETVFEIQKQMQIAFDLNRNKPIEKGGTEFDWWLSFFQTKILLECYSKNANLKGEGYLEFFTFAHDHQEELEKCRDFPRRLVKINDFVHAYIGGMNTTELIAFNNKLLALENKLSENKQESHALLKPSLLSLQQKLRAVQEANGLIGQQVSSTAKVNQKVTICWYGNNLNQIEESRSQLYSLGQKGTGAVMFATTEPNQMGALSEGTKKFFNPQRISFASLQLQGDFANRILLFEDLIWLHCEGGKVKSCVVGNEIPAIQYAMRQKTAR